MMHDNLLEDIKIPNPREIEKELGEFLTKKFGGNVRVISPDSLPEELTEDEVKPEKQKRKKLRFDLKPEDLIEYLNHYVVKQDMAKAALATKICTHFNRIKRLQSDKDNNHNMVGSIKNNILMIGPTGVGKTYIIKLIAKRIGVPFVKGDATKFSETGYVGGDVEDLIRDLVREADEDIELAQCGIVYIDEIDKIAGNRNIVGADISRTGVQRALLKPMEETEIDLRVSHDPISMFQELEHFRKTGNRKKRTINTKNILFIMSGAFGELSEIIDKRLTKQAIGFGADIKSPADKTDILKHVKSEDVIEFGFESEFVGRLPVRSVFERLNKDDLFDILKNPNNPVILGKKLDFAAYDIDIKFDDKALRILSKNAFKENTGARGLISALEGALLLFEKRLPSTDIRRLSVTEHVVLNPEKALIEIESGSDKNADTIFEKLSLEEKAFIRNYLKNNAKNLAEKYKMKLTPSRIDIVAEYYVKYIVDVNRAVEKIKSYHDDIKQIELYFYKEHDINIVMEDDAVDFIIRQLIFTDVEDQVFYKKLTADFELGLKLVQEKTGINRFFINKDALVSPERFISAMIKDKLNKNELIND